MAEQKDILLKVQADMSDATQKMAELADKVSQLSKVEKELKEDIATATEKWGEESNIVKSLKQQLVEVDETKKAYRKEISEVSRSVQNAIVSDVEYNNTLKGQCALLSQLKDQLRAMPLVMDENGNVAKKQSEEYTALQNRIKGLSDSISQQEQAYGTYSRNVGNYANSIIQAGIQMGGSFGGAVKGIQGATGALQLMSKTPVVGILGLVASVLTKVIAGLKGSEENANRVSQALGGLKAIGDIVTLALQGLGKALGAVAEGLGKAFKWVAERLPQMAQVNERMETRNRLAREEIELNKAQRQSSIDVAQNELRVSELRAKASDKDKYSASERLAFLNDALKTELEISQQRYEIAEKEYKLIAEKNAQTDSSKEELDAEAQAQVKMLEARRTYYEMERSMQRQIVSAKKEMRAEEKAIEEERKRAQEEALEAQEEMVKAYWSLTDKLADKLTTNATEKQANSIRKQYKSLALELKQAVANGTMTFEEAIYYRVALTEQMNAELNALNTESNDEQAKADEELRRQEEERMQAELEHQKEVYARKKEMVWDYVQGCTDIFSDFNSVIANLDERRTAQLEADNEKQKASLEARLKAGIISQESYNTQVAKLDADLDKKKADIARKQAIRERALSVFEIAVNTAKAVMKIWAEVPKADFGVSTGVLTALAIAQGALQSTAVLSAPLPTARKGGLVQGATHEAGGVLINTENDERIIGANPSRAFPELLNLISYIGKNVPNSGFAERVNGTSVTNISNGAGIDTQQLTDAMKQAMGEVQVWLSLAELREAEKKQTNISNLSRL